MDLVLRNNITTEERPWGVYHPEERYHHIKKENIGLIEEVSKHADWVEGWKEKYDISSENIKLFFKKK